MNKRATITSLDEGVPFNDLAPQWRQIEKETLPEIADLFNACAFSLGKWVDLFEAAASQYLGVSHAIGVNSGTSALHLALIAAGIGPGSKVLVPANTFVATAWAVLYVGATPVFCDVDPVTWTIDVADAEKRLDPDTKAIVPVHLYGQPADMAAIRKFADHYKLQIVEDAAQAIGARYGRNSVGSIGQFGCFSFYPGKNLGAAGEGGLITTNDNRAATRIRALRNHAQSERYIHTELGFNYRMEGIQGLVLNRKLGHLDSWTEERRRVAKIYCEEFSGLPFQLPEVANGDHVWHLFVVHTPERDRLREHLTSKNVGTGLHYPVPLPRQPCFAHCDFDRGSFPHADRNGRECLSLPMFAGISESQIGRVIEAVKSFYE